MINGRNSMLHAKGNKLNEEASQTISQDFPADTLNIVMKLMPILSSVKSRIMQNICTCFIITHLFLLMNREK